MLSSALGRVGEVISGISATAIVVGGVAPYIPQYRTINKTGSTDGFSLYVCMTLLLANVLRIFFWIGRPFELPLLWQSFVMIAVMFVMLHLCKTVEFKAALPPPPRASHFYDLRASDFWRWTDFADYVQCTLAFMVTFGMFYYLVVDIPLVVELVGFFAVLIEAMLGVPQFLHNLSHHSTEGMSTQMVAMWFCGDVFKTCYFFLREAPSQFTVCGVFQVCVDVAILCQVIAFGQRRPSAAVPALPFAKAERF